MKMMTIIIEQMLQFHSRSLDCGNHFCDKPCHPGECESCPRLPANVTHCPCGARPLTEFEAPPRASCLDPIATCDNVCDKPLDCGPKGRSPIKFL